MKLYIYLLAASLLWQGEKISKSDDEWRTLLGQERYQIMRRKGTERAFLGKYVLFASEGIYCCAACDLTLFSSTDKYVERVGWPTFKQPIDKKNIYYLEDWSLGFKRYEVLCRRCDSHLGHVFRDGPPPKFFRYTINSLSIEHKNR